MTTPDVVNSRVVKKLEVPQLLELHRDREVFALGIITSVKADDGGTDYDAPERLLEIRPGTLSGVDQQSAERYDLLALIRGLVWHRIANLHKRIEAAVQTFHLSFQTRNTPQVNDRTGDELDIRHMPSGHERLPSAEGFQGLKDTIGPLPDAVTRSEAHRLRVAGGAHFSVAFAVGAALQSSRIGHMDVTDQNRSPLGRAMAKLANCADIYRRCDDTNRRLCDRSFFTKVFINEDDELRVEHNRPFDMLLDPQVNANALTWPADANKARTSTNVSVGKGSSLVRAVEVRGFEPLTFSMPWRRATNCAIPPRT